MKLPVSLGIKPALITAAVLLAVIAVLMFNLKLANAAADTALASQGNAESARDAARTERDSWKSKTEDAQAANRAYDVIFEKQRQAAEEQQRQADAAAAKAAAQVAAAKREEAQAERQLADFKRRSAAKPATCAAALQAMQAACPMLEGF